MQMEQDDEYHTLEWLREQEVAVEPGKSVKSSLTYSPFELRSRNYE